MRYIIPTLGCILLAILITGFTPAKADSVPDAVEFALLKKFYDSLAGSGWTTKTNWPVAGAWPASATSAQFGTWYGVTVVNGDISKIVMANNKLTGKLPRNLGDLQALTVLDLNTNTTLTGSIPASIGTIATLQQLYLYRCKLSGAIPTGITNLSNLTNLRLDGDDLTGSIPSTIGNLTALTQLWLFDNELSGTLPASLGDLSNLKDLQVYTNSLGGSIPTSLGKLSKLQILRLDDNQLTGSIPAELGNLAALTQLYLLDNQLSGSIPASLGNLVKLTALYLHTNALTGQIPAALGGLPLLQQLQLQGNKLSGAVPPELGDFPSLQVLNLSENDLSGPIPESFGDLTKLVNLYLQGNEFSGTLPLSLQSLTKLRYFYVHANKLTGSVPAQYSALTELLGFYAYNNQLSGELPPALMSSWTKIQLINIANNKFSGAFPTSVGSSTVLTSLVANNNQFTTLPTGILSLGVLTVLNFDNNELTSIPAFASHGNKANLTLTLSGNRLDFGVMEPLMNVGIKSVVLANQKNIRDVTTMTASVNSSLIVPARDPGSHGSVTWEKQQTNGVWASVGSSNEDATSKTYRRNSFALTDEGVYRWVMTNPIVSGVTIKSDPITVKTSKHLVLDNWAFLYKYDARHRQIGKKAPGADWMYMIYDDRDRVVMTQDGEQRKANKWMYILYDALNRPIITGVYTHSGYVDQAGMSALISATVLYESYTGNSGNHGYSNTVFATPNFVPANFDPQTITYYDTYDFKDGWGSAYGYTTAQIANQTIYGVTYAQPDSAFTRVVGQVTGVKVKTIEEQPYWLYTVNYYDDHYRVVQVVADNLKGGTDRMTNLYDFAGKVLATKNSHTTGTISWKNQVAVKTDGDNLVKTNVSAGWGNSGASSVEQIAANTNGWVEATVAEVTTRRMFGLSKQDTDQNYTSMDYAFYLNNATLTVYAGGNPAYTVASGIVTGDRLRIARESGYINFYKNGVKVYPTKPSEQITSADVLMADVSIYNSPGTIRYARMSAGQRAPQAIARTFDYDHAGRLLKTWHQVDQGVKVLLAQNEYNELGQLIDKKLYSTDPETTSDAQRTFKQSVDYRYNTRGWITSINNSTLTKNAQNKDSLSSRDLFGMNLAYNEFTDAQNKSFYNGNISAIRWSNSLGLGDVKENAYNYDYDPMNRIKSADFRQKKSSWGLPEHKDKNGNTQTAAAYTETGYQYDLNGNITNLTRKTAKGIDMDVLSYFYGAGPEKSNKLLSVSDAGDTQQGFIDGNIAGDDYIYDANGSMAVDKNKDITAITYNYLHLPDKVTKSSGEYIKYTYDATGRKLRQQVYNSTAVQQKKSDYAGEFFYENDTLRFINHEEGRIVTESGSREYQYFMKDHLGNIRITFTTKVEIDSSRATLETADAATESEQFLNYDESVKVNSPLFDHTHIGKAPDPTQTYYSVLLRGESGTTQEKYGLAKSLSVMPGDTIKMEVFAKYIALAGTSVATEVGNVLTSISNGPTVAGTFVDGGALGSLGGAAFPFLALLTHTDDPANTAPKAYLNWLVFDRDFNFKNGGYKRITEIAAETGTGMSQHERLAKDLIVEEAGYVYVYLSNENESSVDVFFDDFGVEQVKGPVVQMEDYYPFGLSFNFFARERTASNQFKYNSKEQQDELNIGWLDYGARMYSPELGKWSIIDPLADKMRRFSPYNYGFDNPVRFSDPDGMSPEESLSDWMDRKSEEDKKRGTMASIIDRADQQNRLFQKNREDIEKKNADRSDDKEKTSIQQAEPNRETGGFIDGDKFYDYMKIRAKTWKIEVAAVVLKHGDDFRYFILPWKNNGVAYSDSYVENLSDVLPGYTLTDVASWVHTHNIFVDPKPSPGDQEFSDNYKKPVYVISPGVDYVYENGAVSEYNGY